MSDVRGRPHLRTARWDGEKREEAGTMKGQNEKKTKTPEKCRAWVRLNWKPGRQKQVHTHFFVHLISVSALSCCYKVCNPLLLYCKIPLVSIILSVGSDHTVTLTWFSALHASHSTQPHPPITTNREKGQQAERNALQAVEIIYTIKSRL